MAFLRLDVAPCNSRTKLHKILFELSDIALILTRPVRHEEFLEPLQLSKVIVALSSKLV